MDFGKFLGGLGNAAVTYGTGVGQVLTGNFGGAVKTAQTNPYSTPSKPTTGGGTTWTPSGGNTPLPTYQAPDNSALYAQLNALQAQIAAQPKLPYYDIGAARAQASNTAASVVNPVYQDKINKFLAKAAEARTQKTTDINRGKEDLTTALTQSLEDTATNRTRTSQDVASKIGETNYQEGQFQNADAAQFDATNRDARVGLADAGLTTSGLGSQKLEQLQLDRNTQSADQLRTFENQRQTQELFKTRTFEDLGTKDTRSTQLTDRQKEGLDIDLNNFIVNQGLDEQGFRADTEAERLNAMFQATEQSYQSQVGQFIASLINSGARSQDIALAQQVYA